VDKAIITKKVHAQITDESRPAWQRYREVVVGPGGLRLFLWSEFLNLALSGVPGALGLFLRTRAYRTLLAATGRGTVFGRHVVLRHPRKIRLGDRVVVDDGCVLDARGNGNRGIVLGDDVIMARNVILGCKNGEISIGSQVGIGAYSIIHSVDESSVSIGSNVFIGPYAYIAGGSNYHTERTDIPIWKQGLDLRGGIRIHDNVMIGAKAVIMDGVTIGRDANIGAGAVVTHDVPDFAVAVGIPAKVQRIRESKAA
jgi:acetyltransferase-like isoleucine patch superfamily enzyme